MKLATLADGTPDGRLHIISRDHLRCQPARAARTLQEALESWAFLEAALTAEYDALNHDGGAPFDPALALAPLPRAWQWLDGSAYDSHGELMQKAFKLPPVERGGRPLMYQGTSDRFYGPRQDVRLPSEDDGIDFEAEFGVIVDAVPMETSGAEALRHIRLLVQIND